MTLYEQAIDLWQNMFTGEKKLFFFFGFCMITFAISFVLIWLSAVTIELYSYLFLRKKYPDLWKERISIGNTKGTHYYYKQWLKGKIDRENIFCKIARWHGLFGKMCLGIWFAVISIVGVLILIKQ